jgi:hypothetical protein
MIQRSEARANMGKVKVVSSSCGAGSNYKYVHLYNNMLIVSCNNKNTKF